MTVTLDIKLTAHTEPLADTKALPPPIQAWLAGQTHPIQLLWHQAETFRKLQETPVVYNTSATGTGKTLASQLHLLRGPEVTVVIAPTNALVHQHAESWRDFCHQAGLNHCVEGIDAARLREVVPRYSEGHTNNARLLFKLIRNRHQCFNTTERQPLVLVINPDLYYLATFQLYERTAHRAAEAFLMDVDYLVIDEFHYYSGIQLVALFFTLGFWHLTGRFKDEPHLNNRRVCLLTATPEPEVEELLNGLRRWGLNIGAIDPSQAPSERERIVSLAPCHLTLKPAGDDPAAIVQEHLEHWQPEVLHEGIDAAALMDSLSGVSRVYGGLRLGFGDAVRRITGPTPPEQRREAEATPLLLATPTVDLGYNFRSRNPNKRRQPLDRLVFEAPTRPRFWQRLGRAGRVLRASVRNVPSRAIGLLPGDILTQLHTQFPEGGTLTRTELAKALDDLGASYDEWRVAPLLSEWAALAIAKPMVALYDSVSDEGKEIVKRLFNELTGLFGGTRRTFGSFRAELEAVEEAKAIARTGKVENKHRLRWMRDGNRWLTDEERTMYKAHMRSAKPEEVRPYAAEAVAKYQASMAFRGSGRLGLDLLAWDTLGLYADRSSWVRLSLEEVVRRTHFTVLDARRLNHFPQRPDIYNTTLLVELDGRLDCGRNLRVVRRLQGKEKMRNFMGGVQADGEMSIRAVWQAQGHPTAPLPTEVVELLQGKPLVYFIPWPQHVARLLESPQSKGLWRVHMIFSHPEWAQEKTCSGFIQQHAVIAYGLLQQLNRTAQHG